MATLYAIISKVNTFKCPFFDNPLKHLVVEALNSSMISGNEQSFYGEISRSSIRSSKDYRDYQSMKLDRSTMYDEYEDEAQT